MARWYSWNISYYSFSYLPQMALLCCAAYFVHHFFPCTRNFSPLRKSSKPNSSTNDRKRNDLAGGDHSYICGRTSHLRLENEENIAFNIINFMKNLVLVFNSVASALIFVFYNSVSFGLCAKKSYDCRTIVNTLENSCYIFVLALFFSLVTYKAPEMVFATWWKFAQWTTPVIFVVSIVINLGYFHSDGGFLNMNDTVDQVLLGFMYILFTIGSIIQIIRGYRAK